MTTAVFLSNKIKPSQEVTAIGLDAVTSFQVEQSAGVTNHPMEDGSKVSDHYFKNTLTASFSGVISPWNFTSKGVDVTPKEFISQVNNLIDQGVLFDLYLSDDLDSIRSCVITSFSYSREVKEGKSILVDVKLQQIDIVESAQTTIVDDVFLAEDVKRQGQSTQENGDEVTKTAAADLFSSAGVVLGVSSP